MLQFLKRLFCFHSWEYDLDIYDDEFKECRKCEKIKYTKTY